MFRPKTPVRFGRVAAPRPSGRGRVVLLADKVGFGSNLSPSGVPSAPVPLARSLVCEGSLMRRCPCGRDDMSSEASRPTAGHDGAVLRMRASYASNALHVQPARTRHMRWSGPRCSSMWTTSLAFIRLVYATTVRCCACALFIHQIHCFCTACMCGTRA